EMADKGKVSMEFRRLRGIREREEFDDGSRGGLDYISSLRENQCDYLFIRNYLDQDFVDRHRLFVAGKRLNQQRMTWEYYVKSRKAEDYRQMVLDTLYHPPSISVDTEESREGILYLVHDFEGKPLVKDYIGGALMGIEFLWGGEVKLETSVVVPPKKKEGEPMPAETAWKRAVYGMKGRKLSMKEL
ncbi:MAG TPA: SpoVR family protein, partial [Verrucomicrobiae bacterium]|nr:SpoVR family protein [Verrucomicrobiae bacterium]